MTDHRFVTDCAGSHSWALRVAGRVFGPYKSCGRCRDMEVHIRNNVQKYGFERAMELGERYAEDVAKVETASPADQPGRQEVT